MSLIDKALTANKDYAKNYDPTLGKRPAPKVAVVTCMDPRLSDLQGILGLPNSDLDVIRTGGPAVTEDVLGLHVTVDEVGGVRCSEAVEGAGYHPQGLDGGEAPGLALDRP